MKELHKPLNDGRIPLVEIANILFNDWIEELDSNIPEFDDNNRLLTSVVGDKNGCGVNTYLFFDPDVMLFKELYCDRSWTRDNYRETIKIVDYNPLLLIKKLNDMGIFTNVGMELKEECEVLEETDVDKIVEKYINYPNNIFSGDTSYWVKDKTELNNKNSLYELFKNS